MDHHRLQILSLCIAISVALPIGKTAHAVSPGEKVPPFELPGVDDTVCNSRTILPQHTATVIFFTSNTCPVAIAYENRIIALAREFAPRKVIFLAINANDATKIPEEGPAAMKVRASEKGFPFPYLWDETQSTAKAFGAKVTPHFFVADSSSKIRYVGRLDNNQREDPNVNTSPDLKNALEAILAGNEPPSAVTKAFGCGIQWKQ